MTQTDTFKGVNSTVHKFTFRILALIATAMAAVILSSCSGGPASNTSTGGVDPNEVAARVNGKDIKMEEVEKGVKAQSQGQEAYFSPLELASARLTVLQQLIQTDVMYQKAEKEGVLPTDEEVTTEMNKRRTASGLSADEFQKQMEKAGENEQSWRLNVKKELALKKLQEKITGQVTPPKDKEIEDFYNTNKDQFKNKRGAQLGAIVIDPANSGQGDVTTNQDQANARAKEIGQRALTGSDFATLAREASEDLQTRSSGGDWRSFTEEELKETFGDGVADYIMTKMTNGQIIPQAIPLQGRLLIIKLQHKQERDEDVTLESPNVRQRVTNLLVEARKNLLWQSYGAIAMNEAKVENFLAQKVVANPNELSGARPAAPPTPANANTNAAAPANANSNASSTPAANAAANARPAASPAANNRPAATPNRPAATPAARPANANSGQ
jgi:peptidyl-prolyl cis-trans isomerase SurA